MDPREEDRWGSLGACIGMEGATGYCLAISAPASASSRFMEAARPELLARRCCTAGQAKLHAEPCDRCCRHNVAPAQAAVCLAWATCATKNHVPHL